MFFMRVLRLAWIIAAVLATGGATAAPARVVESTRLVVTCAWLQTDPAKPALAQPARPRAPQPTSLIVRISSDDAPHAPQVFPTSLQRPPPTTT